MTSHQLSKITPSAVVKSNTENEVVKASKSALFTAFKPEDKAAALLNIIQTAYFDTGYTVAGTTDKDRADHVKAIVTRLSVLVPEQFPFITGAEIRLACRNGASGAYGELHGINPRTVLSWLTEYQSRKGKIILEATPLLPPPPIPEPTKEEWREKMIALLRKNFAIVQAQQEPVDWGNVLFRYLRENGLIVVDQADIDSYMEQATALIISENNPLDAVSFGELTDRKKLIKLITSQEATAQKQVVIRARNLALREYLMMIDLEEEIEKLKNLPLA